MSGLEPTAIDSTAEGWLVVTVPSGLEAWAEALREERDRRYENIYEEARTDVRWVGELGEAVFDWWLRESGVSDYQWHVDDPAGRPDFVLYGLSVGVKTVKRKHPFRRGWTCQVTERHVDEPVDSYFFCSYELPRRHLWMIGGCSRRRFVAKAETYTEGQQVHPNYTVRRGHTIRNVDEKHITPPATWLNAVWEISEQSKEPGAVPPVPRIQ